MPDESESGEQMKPEEQQEREIEALPGESFHARLKRISQMPRKEGESKFVKIRGGQFGRSRLFRLRLGRNRMTRNLTKRMRSISRSKWNGGGDRVPAQ